MVDRRVIEIIKEQAGLKEINLSENFKEMAGDSLEEIEIVMALEEEFGIDIPDGEVMQWNTVQDAIDYINSKVK